MVMPGRSYSSSNGYRYGFNGQEKSSELNDNLYTAEYWEYDSRIGRRWNIDPVDKPWQTPYHAFSNKPITNIDPNGADDGDYYDKDGKYVASDGIKDDKVYHVEGDKFDIKDFEKGGKYYQNHEQTRCYCAL